MNAKQLHNEHPAFGPMFRRWELSMDLLGGTLSMQDAGERWLPMETKEKPEQYRSRLSRAVLNNALGRTIKQVSTKPFRNPVTVTREEVLPEVPGGILADVDLAGRSVTQFAMDVAKDAEAFGMALWLVEWNAARERPYWKQIQPGSLYHWREDPESGHIVEIRFKLEDVRPDEQTGELELVEVIWRYFVEEGSVQWERYIVRKEGAGDEIPEEAGILADRNGKAIDEIPLVAVYANRVDTLVASPPFEDLAELNRRHWQAYADLANLLRFVTIPLLVRKGGKRTGSQASETDGKVESSVTISASSLVDVPEGVDIEYVEMSGEAVNAAMADLKSIEELMETEGDTPTMRASVQTATRSVIDEQSREAGMTAFVRSLETALTLGLHWFLYWSGVKEVPEDLAAEINEDRNISGNRKEHADIVLRARKDRVITNQRALIELKKSKILGEDLDEEDETARVSRESSDLVDGLAAFPDRDDEFGAGVFSGEEGEQE